MFLVDLLDFESLCATPVCPCNEISERGEDQDDAEDEAEEQAPVRIDHD